jgi:hypothetical protein
VNVAASEDRSDTECLERFVLENDELLRLEELIGRFNIFDALGVAHLYTGGRTRGGRRSLASHRVWSLLASSAANGRAPRTACFQNPQSSTKGAAMGS